ncbi:MAG: DUF167 domain-containing protein [Candidatus Hydrothermia bacterium]
MSIKIKIRVTPGAKKYGIEFDEKKDFFIVSVKEPATDNLANRALVEMFSRRLGLPKEKVKIIKGFREPRKILEILEELDFSEIKRRLLG